MFGLSHGFSYYWGRITHKHQWSLWSDVVPNQVSPKKIVMGRWRTCETCGKREFKKTVIVSQQKP